MSDGTARFEWDDEKEARAKRLYMEENRSGTQIAEELGGGLTRSAVMGKLHRMGCKKGPKAPGTASASRRPRRPSAPRTPVASVPRVSRPYVAPEPPQDPADVMPEPSGAMGLTAAVEGMKKGHCKAPLSDPHAPDFRYCNAGTDGGPYCPYHAGIYLRAPARRRR